MKPTILSLFTFFSLLAISPLLGTDGTPSPSEAQATKGEETASPGLEALSPSPASTPEEAEQAHTPSKALGAIPPLMDFFDECQVQVSTGRSGALKTLTALPGEPLSSHIDLCGTPAYWSPVDPEDKSLKTVSAGVPITAPTTPGAYRLILGDDEPNEGSPVLFVLYPFEGKKESKIDSYRLGYWPGERGGKSSYDLPLGFIKVSKAVADVYLSERLKVKQFITKNQHGVWSKYMLIDLRLIDKLELIAQDLRERGLPGSRIYIMSGFRTPEYNAPGVGKGGRASNSRHIYGDASDMWIDNDGNARLDDMNGDGKVDTRDVRVMLAAQTRVEAAWPELVGGGGVYRSNAVHGPFLHVDVRGHVARWGAK